MKKSDRIDRLIKFLKEIEKLKTLKRKTYLSSQRPESVAEHSWHVAMFAIVFEKDFKLDVLKVLKLALTHDLVEIYAGDPFSFDKKARLNKEQREEKAAEKLFNLLPNDLNKEFKQLFAENENCRTKEAKFAQSFDKIQPILQNILSDGKGWKKYGITYQNVDDYKKKFFIHDKKIMRIYKIMLNEGFKKGFIKKEKNVR